LQLSVLAFVLVLALALAGAAASDDRLARGEGVAAGAQRVAGVGASPAGRLLGVLQLSRNSRRVLARLDPRSLRPRGRRVVAGEYHGAWSFSPDRSQVALGVSRPARDGRVGVRIVDVARMRVRTDVLTGVAAEALAWLAPDRLVAVLQSGEVVVIDPALGEVVRRWDLSGRARFYFPTSARAPGMLVAVLVSAGALQPARVVVVDADGRLRSTRLRRVRVGQRRSAGLALDLAGNRAFVAGAKAPLAEIDLDTMRVRYRRLRGRAGTDAARGRVLSSDRRALWLGRGRLALVGRDDVRTRRGRIARVPSGVQVVDTRRWTARTIARRASAARLAAGRLLVYQPSQTMVGAGLGIHTRPGRRLHHLLGNRALDVQTAGRRAYAIGQRAVRVVDVRSGKVVHTAKRPPGIAEIEFLTPRLGASSP
jgi:hypothetical protein